MSEAAIIEFPQDGRPSDISPEEWQARCELAAAYRLCHLYGWTDLNNTHLSLRVPGTKDHFLLNPFGMFFEEITASSLIKVDGEGNLLGESDYPMNPAGFVIHGAIHMSGDERHCVLHTHSRYGTAVSMQKHGLLPVSQKALTIMGFVGYHDFEGPAVDAGEQLFGQPQAFRHGGDAVALGRRGMHQRAQIAPGAEAVQAAHVDVVEHAEHGHQRLLLGAPGA